MKKVRVIFVVCFMFLAIPNNVFAHPGRTNSSGCHACRSNCSAWGLDDGEYHCHSGNTYSNSKGQVFNQDGSLISGGSSPATNNSNNSNSSNNYSTGSNSSNTNNSNNNGTNTNSSNTTIYKKSSNANLGSLTVDGKNINVSDHMNFSTTNTTPNIIGIPEHNKANIKIDKPEKFSENLLNEVTITVTAEDSTVKKYKLFIDLISNDATLKSLKIGKKEVKINDEMSFVTTDSKIVINAVTNNKNAKFVSNKEYNLNIGDNKIIIKVLAEDKTTVKEYVLKVTRKAVLSDNIGIIIFVNGEKVKFNNFNSEIVYISSSIDEINIKYRLEDKKSKIDLEYDKKINVGNRTIKFKVIAETGKEQEYILNLYKYSKTEEIVYTILGVALIGGIGFGIYKIFKKIKTRRKDKKKTI